MLNMMDVKSDGQRFKFIVGRLLKCVHVSYHVHSVTSIVDNCAIKHGLPTCAVCTLTFYGDSYMYIPFLSKFASGEGPDWNES